MHLAKLGAIVLFFAAASVASAQEANDQAIAEAKKSLLDVVVGTEDQSAARVQAVGNLAAFDKPSAVQGLVEALDKLSARTTQLEVDAAKTRDSFGPYKDPGAARGFTERKMRDRLMKLMSDQDSLLRGDFAAEQAFMAAIAGLKTPEAIAAADRAVTKDEVARSRMVLYVGLLRNPATKVVDLARRSLGDPDAVVRQAAMAVVPQRQDPDVILAVVKLLGHADKGVRETAAKALGAWGDVRAVNPLISALATDDGTLGATYSEALKTLTGAKIGADAPAWKKWFAVNKMDLANKVAQSPEMKLPDGRAPKPETIDLGEVKIRGKKVCFVLDISGSMNEEMGKENVTGEWLSGKKIDIAKKMMHGFILKLPDNVFFNVIAYNHEVQPLEELPIEATLANKHLMIRKVDELVARGATWTYGALKTAFGQMSNMTGNPYDTIVLLSDGAPTEYLPEGEVESKPQDPQTVIDAVHKWNSWGEVTIHTIAIDPRIESPTVGGHFIRFMRELAALNNGISTQIGTDTHAAPTLPIK
jgi:HEAT repeat protein